MVPERADKLGRMQVLQNGAVWGRQAAAVVWLAGSIATLSGPARGEPASFADIAEKVNPAVVFITATVPQSVAGGAREPDGALEELFPKWFFQNQPDAPEPEPREGAGSGVLISADGNILTNHHVVESASAIEVRLSDGQSLSARLVGSDPETDLALLKVDADSELPFAPLGDSDAMRVGDWVIAIGNPYGYDHSVTVGVVSGKERRNISRHREFDDFIQTDAAINFGNSGGPLLNADGEVIGINTAIVSPGLGIGFAVPINIAKQVLPQLQSHGRVVRGYIGVSVGAVTAETQQAFALPGARGALVNDVVPGKPAERAGLQHGDVILEVNGEAVEDSSGLVRRISGMQPGDRAELTIWRDGGRRQLAVVLADRSADGPAAPEPILASANPREPLGLSVDEVTPRLRRELKLDPEVRGVVVTAVEPGSAAAQAGLEQGMVLTEINRQPLGGLDDFERRLADALRDPAELVLFYALAEGGRGFFVTASKPQ
ncbi:MAG TPA: Do family serine endopeptidase [Acidobacteriota bacterium]